MELNKKMTKLYMTYSKVIFFCILLKSKIKKKKDVINLNHLKDLENKT